MATYSEMFPLDMRIVVRASHGTGTDELWNGAQGRVVRWYGNAWADIYMDKPKRGWPNPVVICGNHLRIPT